MTVEDGPEARLPGGRDRQGHPILTAVVPSGPRVGDGFGAALRGLVSVLGPETKRAGITVLLDARRCPWRSARAAMRACGVALGSDIGQLIVLRPEAFWDNQRVDCTKVQKDGEPIFIPISRLHKFIEASQLTAEFGGTWTYSHSQWVHNRMCIESYMNDVDEVLGELTGLQQRLQEFTAGDRISTATDPMSFSKLTYDTNTAVAQAIYHRGRDLVNRIEKTERDWALQQPQHHRIPQDMIDTRDKLESTLQTIEKSVNAVESAWVALQKKYLDEKEIKRLEEGVARVTSWILGTAEALLHGQQQVGYDVSSSEELRAEHEALELQCRDTYGHYAEMLHKIDMLPQLNIYVPEDLRSQRDFMDFVCRSFATRLERRRNILITCRRFYRLVTQYFEMTSDVFESLIMTTDSESFEAADCTLQQLSDSQLNIDILAKELVKEGEKLSDILSMPVKDALGRDMDVNYESDILNVRDILQATLSRKQLFSDSVDLQKLTLEQLTHIHAYELDAQQAVKWLTDLYKVLIKDIHVGCSVHEIQLMKEQLHSFQETAKGTYEYGAALLTASLALRRSCKLTDDYTIELQQRLGDTWRRLESVTQEQMTRLRVCAVFHRTVNEQCTQLRDLTTAVSTLVNVPDAGRRRSKMKRCLQTRERLLLEVGRMVRLGRLLKTRLREPLLTQEECSDEANIESVEAISERVAEVTQLAEQLDTALCNVQVPGTSAEAQATPTTTIKQIIDGTAPPTPQDWYGSLKSPKATPNTSSDSKSEDEFLTASECTCTPPSRSSSFQTASEGGPASPWWEIEPSSDNDDRGKPRKDESSAVRTRQLSSEISTRELSETVQTNSQGLTSLMLQSSSGLLRPDMTPIRNSQRESSDDSSRTSEIVNQLSQIVHRSEEAARDADTSSQYSSEMLNPDASHTKSLSFDTDNTDLSLPRFSSTAPAVPKLNGVKKSTPADEEAAYRKELERFSADEKIYIIDASTPSPKSQRYLETSFELYDVPRGLQEPAPEEGLEERLQEVRPPRRPVTTISLQALTHSPGHTPHQQYCPPSLKRMAIQGIF